LVYLTLVVEKITTVKTASFLIGILRIQSERLLERKHVKTEKLSVTARF
jgi:hypothetical protein